MDMSYAICEVNRYNVYTQTIDSLVRMVGLEPTRSPTRPLNVRVCHSATTASMDYVSIIIFCCQEILKKNLLLVS